MKREWNPRFEHCCRINPEVPGTPDLLIAASNAQELEEWMEVLQAVSTLHRHTTSPSVQGQLTQLKYRVESTSVRSQLVGAQGAINRSVRDIMCCQTAANQSMVLLGQAVPNTAASSPDSLTVITEAATAVAAAVAALNTAAELLAAAQIQTQHAVDVVSEQLHTQPNTLSAPQTPNQPISCPQSLVLSEPPSKPASAPVSMPAPQQPTQP